MLRHKLKQRLFDEVRHAYPKNNIVDCDDHLEISLYNKDGDVIARSKIDKDDYFRVAGFRWYLCSRRYPAAHIGKNNVLLHTFLIGSKRGQEIDHINRDKLDNRKSNLRHVTHRLNLVNRSVKGVSWWKSGKLWRARLMVNGKEFYKYFKTRAEALSARKQMEQQYYGDFIFN